MRRVTLIYGFALALGAFFLHWLKVQYAFQLFPPEFYIVVVALFFAGVGAWLGIRLTGSPRNQTFEKNDKAIKTLGLTAKEVQVLELLAEGGSNNEIAKQLFVSTSTIKTHLVHLYQKLEVSRRTQAVQRARTLQIIS